MAVGYRVGGTPLKKLFFVCCIICLASIRGFRGPVIHPGIALEELDFNQVYTVDCIEGFKDEEF